MLPHGTSTSKPKLAEDFASVRDLVAEDKALFDAQCIACHDEGAAGGSQHRVFGGIGSFTTNKRKLTPGNMYPYAPILFDYVHRAMPMKAPQS